MGSILRSQASWRRAVSESWVPWVPWVPLGVLRCSQVDVVDDFVQVQMGGLLGLGHRRLEVRQPTAHQHLN